jgi:hypothetical protein
VSLATHRECKLVSLDSPAGTSAPRVNGFSTRACTGPAPLRPLLSKHPHTHVSELSESRLLVNTDFPSMTRIPHDLGAGRRRAITPVWDHSDTSVHPGAFCIHPERGSRWLTAADGAAVVGGVATGWTDRGRISSPREQCSLAREEEASPTDRPTHPAIYLTTCF